MALDRLSRSLHSGVCDSDGYCDAVVHSRISGRGNWRLCAIPNESAFLIQHMRFVKLGFLKVLLDAQALLVVVVGVL